MPNYSHLANAIQRRARELGLDQEALVNRSGMGRTTVQRLWAGKAVHEPSRRTKQDMERVLEWEPGSFDAAAGGGTPTPLRASMPEEVKREPPADRPPGAGQLPIRLQLAMGQGQLLDYDVLELEVDGQPFSFVAFAQTGADYGTEESQRALTRQLEMFRRMIDKARKEGESGDDDTGTDADDH